MHDHMVHQSATLLQQLTNIPASFWGVLADMAPYLLLGFLIAGILSVLVSAKMIERHLGGKGLWPVVKAAILGVPLPLCSCGVIPVSASLSRHGASKGATTSFLISTPETGIDSILVTYSLLGGVFAIFRPLVAFVSGIIGGGLVALLDRDEAANSIEGETLSEKATCKDACCKTEARGGKIGRIFSYGLWMLPKDIAPSLLVGLLIAAGISAFLQPQTLAPYLGSGLFSIFAMMLVGIPIYVCATASVPIVAVLILEQGLSPGAAFAFLVTGPATNAAAIAVIWRVLGRRTAIIYLLTIASTAIAGGVVLDYFFDMSGMKVSSSASEMLPTWFSNLSAVGLLGLLLAAIIVPRLKRQSTREQEVVAEIVVAGNDHCCGNDHDHEHEPAQAHEPESVSMRLKILGMTCSHCASAVKRALLETPGVTSAEVVLATGEASLNGRGIDFQKVSQSLESLGYNVRKIE